MTQTTDRLNGTGGVSFLISIVVVVVGCCVLLPINWIRMKLAHEFPPDSLDQFWSGISICVIIDLIGALALWGLVRWRSRMKARNFAILAARASVLRSEIEALQHEPLQSVQISGLVMRPGELAYAAHTGELMEVHTTGYAGRSGGVSVRVAKGVTLRSGGSSGHAVKSMVAVSAGFLALTDRRVVFAGTNKSFDVPFGKLTNFFDAQDGLVFNAGTVSHHVRLNLDYGGRLKMKVVLQRLIDQANQVHKSA